MIEFAFCNGQEPSNRDAPQHAKLSSPMLKWLAGVIAMPRVIPFKLFRRRADARLDIASNDDAMESVFEEVAQALKRVGLIAA